MPMSENLDLNIGDSSPSSPTSTVTLSESTTGSSTFSDASSTLHSLWVGDNMSCTPDVELLRIGTWNVHGGLAAKSVSGHTAKLDAIVGYMQTFFIDILCIIEPGSSARDVRFALPSGYSVFGYDTKSYILWITTSKWAPHVRLSGLDCSGRISVLYLSGKNLTRSALIGFYGFTTSGVNRDALSAQEPLLQSVEKLVDRSLIRNREVVWLGDINMVLRPQDSASALHDSIDRLTLTMDSLHLVSAFIHAHPEVSLQDGAFTRHSGGVGTSLIDHINLHPRNLVQCGILVADSIATDHRLVLADTRLPVVASSRTVRDSPDLLMDTWSSYQLHKLRNWHSDLLDSLESRLAEAVVNRDSSGLEDFWTETKQVMSSIHQDCRRKPASMHYRDHEASVLARMLTRWKHVMIEVRRLLPSIGITSHDIRGRLYVLMWGGRSYYSIRKRWTSLGIGSWKTVQMPRKEVMPIHGLSEEGLQYRDAQVNKWLSWLEDLTTTRSLLLQRVRRRSNKWLRLVQSEHRRHKLQDVSGGYTSKLFKQVFPETQVAEPTSVQIGDDWITDPLAVANEIGRAMRSLSPSDEWTRPYCDENATFISGPWLGCHRMVPGLEGIINSGRCHAIRDTLLSALEPVDMSTWLNQLAAKQVSSAPGVTGLGYGVLRSMPVKFQYVALHIRNLICLGVTLPTGLADLLITAIPKPQSSVGGYGGFRPISRYETILKLTTGSVHSLISETLRCSGTMHPNQFFAMRYSGVVDALQLVLHAMELHLRSGGRLVIKSADVASAFPSVQHWYMAMVMRGYQFPEAIVEFFQLADGAGRFSMRTKQSFSDWFSKPDGGIGQGEQGSPSKYALVVDPLLWLLQEHKLKGLYVGEHFNAHLTTIHTDLQSLVIDGFLVAIMFCDDLFMMSSSEEDMQDLIDVVTGFHDLQGSRLVAHKSYYGASSDRSTPCVELSSSQINSRDLVKLTRTWFADNVRVLSAESVSESTEGVTLQLMTDDLIYLGDVLLRKHCSQGISCPNYTPAGCIGSVHLSHPTLTSEFRRLGISCSIRVRHRPLYVLDARDGSRHYIRWVPPQGSFRVLGIQLSPSLDWSNARRVLSSRLATLQGMLEGAARRRDWNTAHLMLAHDGKIMNKLRFDASLIPITPALLDQWTKRHGSVLRHTIRLPLGVSPRLLQHHSDLGLQVTSFWNTTLKSCISAQVMALESDGLLGLISRANLQHYQQHHSFEVCPLALPLHPLEVVSTANCDARWNSLRMLCTQAQISIDSSASTASLSLAPWQSVLPLKPRDLQVPITTLRAHLRTVTNMDTKKISQLYSGKIMGVQNRSHIPQHAYSMLRRWVPALHWPSWQHTVKADFWNLQTVPLDTALEGESGLFVSDATVRSSGESGFCCAGYGQSEYLLGRCNFSATSGDAELCGIMANLEWFKLPDTITTIGCDNVGSLYKTMQRIRSHVPSSRLALKRAAPLWNYLQRQFGRFSQGSLHGIHIKAHTVSSDILPATPTWLQDWCDRTAPDCLRIDNTVSDFFTHDMKFGIFDVKSGYLPGSRKRVMSSLSQLLHGKSIMDDGDDEGLEHIDGSFSWRAVVRIDWMPSGKILHRGNLGGVNAFFWQQHYCFMDGTLTTKSISKSSVRDMYGLLQRIKLMVISGRTWSGTSLLTAEQIDDGEGLCPCCTSPSLDSTPHIWGCTGDRYDSVRIRFSFLHRLHFCHMLSSLYRHRTHGILSSMDGTLPSCFRPQHTPSSDAAVIDVDAYYAVSAALKSDSLHHSMLQRSYRVMKRRYEFYTRLSESMIADTDFRAPCEHREALHQLRMGNLRAPDEPESTQQPLKKSCKTSEADLQISIIGNYSMLTYRLTSIWQHLHLSIPDFRQLMSRSISSSTSKLYGSLPSPLFQESIVRWLGILQCSVLTLDWTHIWDIPLSHVGLHAPVISEDAVNSLWHSVHNWVCGIIRSPMEFSRLMRLLAPHSHTRGLAFVLDSPLLTSLTRAQGWQLSDSFEMEVQPFLGKSVQKTVLVRVRVAAFNIVEVLPEWIFTWSQNQTVFDGSDRLLQADSPFLSSLFSLDWNTRSWHTVTGFSPLVQGMMAGLLPASYTTQWKASGLTKRQMHTLYRDFFFRQLELWHGLYSVRLAIRKAQLVNTSPLLDHADTRTLGAQWSCPVSDTLGLDATAFDSNSGSTGTRLVHARRSSAPSRRTSQQKNFMHHLTAEEHGRISSCSCGKPLSWLSNGLATHLCIDSEQVLTGSALCATCRSYQCSRAAMGQCLHCDNCGHGLDVSDIHYTPPSTVVCKGCAEWFGSRWKHNSLWKSSTRHSMIIDMVIRASEWWAMDPLPLHYAHRIASSVISDWSSALPVRTGPTLYWGWLWCLMQPFLSALNVYPRTTKGPRRCDSSAQWVPMHMPADMIQKWLLRCRWSVFSPDSLRTSSAALPTSWIHLFNHYNRNERISNLQVVQYRKVINCDSEVSSVEGGEISDDDSKTCQYSECPYDVTEDHGTKRTGTIRHLFLCNGCNKGYHRECVAVLSASDSSWQLIDENDDWLCSTCKIQGNGIMSYAIDAGVSKSGSWQVMIKWSSTSTSDITVESIEKLRGQAGSTQVISSLNSRLSHRDSTGQDRHGKLTLYSGHPRVRGKDICHPETIGLNPSHAEFKHRSSSADSFPDYLTWCLTHPSVRLPLPLITVGAWQPTRASRSRKASTVARWDSFYRHWLRSHVARWYLACEDHTETPSIGASYSEFYEEISLELAWLPDADASSVYSHVGIQLADITKADRHHNASEQCQKIVDSIVWVRKKLTQLTAHFDLLPVVQDSVVLIRDMRKYRPPKKRVDMQTTLHNRDVRHMYEDDSQF